VKVHQQRIAVCNCLLEFIELGTGAELTIAPDLHLDPSCTGLDRTFDGPPVFAERPERSSGLNL
jgi:hypothetical protein